MFNGGFASNANSSLSGRLAIGQTTYSGGNTLVDLHASGSGVGSQLKFRNDHNDSAFEIGLAGNTSGDVIFYNNANTDMDFYTNNALRFSITNSEVVVNDSSADVDFRVESNGNANMLFVDGGNDVVNIGGTTAITTAALTVGKTAVGSNTALRIDYNDDNTAPSSVLELSKEGTIFGRFGGASTTVSGAAATAVVVQSQANLYFDATGSFIFNEVGDDVDFRVESDDYPFCLFVNSTQDNVAVGWSAEPQSQAPGLVVLSEDQSGGVVLIKEDGSQPSSGEGLGSFGWQGNDDTNSMNAADARISAFATENHDGSNAATDMRFFIKTTSEGPGNGPIETLRLESNKNVKIMDGNLVIDTAGHGIDFSAQTGTATGTTTAELLDHYEEGTWTPTISFDDAVVSLAYGVRHARYTKVGNVVHASAYVSLTNKGSSVGSAKVGGLPFAAINTTGNYQATTFWASAVSCSGFIQAYIPLAQSYVILQELTTGGTNSNLTNADFANNSEVMINVSYATSS